MVAEVSGHDAPWTTPPWKSLGGVCFGKERRPWSRIDRVELLDFPGGAGILGLGEECLGLPTEAATPNTHTWPRETGAGLVKFLTQSTLKWRKLWFFSFTEPAQGLTESVTRATVSVKLTFPLAAFLQINQAETVARSQSQTWERVLRRARSLC